jgi:hypothetical protein
MDLSTISIDKPDAINFILGQTHFIKTVEDIHEESAKKRGDWEESTPYGGQLRTLSTRT